MRILRSPGEAYFCSDDLDALTPLRILSRRFPLVKRLTIELGDLDEYDEDDNWDDLLGFEFDGFHFVEDLSSAIDPRDITVLQLAHTEGNKNSPITL